MEKLKNLQDLQQQQAEQHRNEMAAQSRLANIYKNASEENDGKIQQLVSQLSTIEFKWLQWENEETRFTRCLLR